MAKSSKCAHEEMLWVMLQEHKHDKTPCNLRLIIVDSISALITPVLGAGGMQHSQGHALMVGLGRLLKHIAAQYTVALLCTNHMVGSNKDPRPALGESWKCQPHVRLQLMRPDMSEDHNAVTTCCCASLNDRTVLFHLN